MPAKLTIPLTIALACGVLAVQAFAATSRTVGLSNYHITISSASAPHGAITFRVTNNSPATTHTFSIKRISTGHVLYNSPLISAGHSVAPTKTLAAGTYQLYCRLPGHAALGMKRNFTVT
ncbi:MAG: Sulfocyanin (SoxE) domain [Gaiellales bacterium]|nr:Sulfocyanin (SoxE) domain [Gaiellales bacterium]